MTFHVGQKVVCVDDSPNPKTDNLPPGITRGQVYTIRKIGWHRGVMGFSLVEVAPRVGWRGWLAKRFRPAVERKTDINVFKRMLIDEPEKV